MLDFDSGPLHCEQFLSLFIPSFSPRPKFYELVSQMPQSCQINRWISQYLSIGIDERLCSPDLICMPGHMFFWQCEPLFTTSAQVYWFLTYLGVRQSIDVGVKVEVDSNGGTWQCYSSDQENQEHYIRKSSCEVNYLEGNNIFSWF